MLSISTHLYSSQNGEVFIRTLYALIWLPERRQTWYHIIQRKEWNAQVPKTWGNWNLCALGVQGLLHPEVPCTRRNDKVTRKSEKHYLVFTSYVSIHEVSNHDVAIHQPLSDHEQHVWFLPSAAVLTRWAPENMAISIIKWSVLTKAHKFFVVGSSFFCCSLNIEKAEHKWANFRILQLSRYPKRQLILLKSLYWLLDISSIFTCFFPYFQSLWPRIFLWFWRQSSALSIIFFTCLFLLIWRFLFRAADSLFSSRWIFLSILPISVF